jgi:hypothetical protein
MKAFHYNTFAFASSLMLALTGCSASQTLTPNTKQTSGLALARHLSSETSLIYATGGCGGVCVLSYPDGQLVGKLSMGYAVNGACSDSVGNVFITNGSEVLEYAHGDSNPIQTLNLPGTSAMGCSVDSKTGNLAVVFSGSGANVAIFPQAQGTPTLYETSITSFYCGYDNDGNLFVSGYVSGATPGIAELRYGTKGFSLLSIVGRLGNPGQMQWDGKHMTYESDSRKSLAVSRLRISGSRASVISTTHFKGSIVYALQSWIFGNVILIPYSIHQLRTNRIGVWNYPEGGKAITKLFADSKAYEFRGVTLSV